jgi:hypothetical protein
LRQVSGIPLAEERMQARFAADPGIGFRVEGIGFRVEGIGFRAEGIGFRVEGCSPRSACKGALLPTQVLEPCNHVLEPRVEGVG